MIINHDHSETKGVFEAIEEGTKIGEMTYSVAGVDKIIIDHTEVNPEAKGQGVGKILLSKAVTYARENNLKIIPLCPFAKRMFEKDVDIRDVL